MTPSEPNGRQLFVNPPGAAYEILFQPSLVQAAEDEDKARLAARGFPVSWAKTGVVYEDPFVILVRDAVRRPDHSLGSYSQNFPLVARLGPWFSPFSKARLFLYASSGTPPELSTSRSPADSASPESAPPIKHGPNYARRYRQKPTASSS